MSLTEERYYGGGQFADTDAGVVRVHRNARMIVVTNSVPGGVLRLPPTRFLQGGTTLVVVNQGTRGTRLEDDGGGLVVSMSSGQTTEIRFQTPGTWRTRSRPTNSATNPSGEVVKVLVLGGMTNAALSSRSDANQQWDGSAWSAGGAVPGSSVGAVAAIGTQVFHFPVLDAVAGVAAYGYDPDRWFSITDMPITKVRACAVGALDAVHVLSGGSGTLDALEHLVYREDAYSYKTASPAAGENESAGHILGKVYLAKSNQTLREWDPAADAWATKAASATTERSNVLQAARDSGAALFHAGGDDGVGFVPQHERYNQATDAWNVRSTMLAGRARHGVGGRSDDYLIAGGLSGSFASPVVESGSAKYDGSSWSVETAMTTAVAQVNAAATLG